MKPVPSPAGLVYADPQTPFVVTAGTSPTALFPNEVEKPAFWLIVAVRSMGTSTYVRLGDSVTQAISLYSANDFQVIDLPPGYILDATEWYCISDGGDVVLEVSGMFPPLPKSGGA